MTDQATPDPALVVDPGGVGSSQVGGSGTGREGTEPASMVEDGAEPPSAEGREGEPAAARQSELDLGVVPTGDVRVDAALAALEGLPERPVDEHPEVYESVHRQLQAALADTPDANG